MWDHFRPNGCFKFLDTLEAALNLNCSITTIKGTYHQTEKLAVKRITGYSVIQCP